VNVIHSVSKSDFMRLLPAPYYFVRMRLCGDRWGICALPRAWERFPVDKCPYSVDNMQKLWISGVIRGFHLPQKTLDAPHST